MVAHAKCLWTAALSALEPAPLGMETATSGFSSATGRDDRGAEVTSSQSGRFASRQDSGSLLPGRNETPLSAFSPSSPGLCAVAPHENRSPAARADRRFPEGARSGSVTRHVRKTGERRLPCSLSYLSLTLCCAALHSGWLEGCATPSSPSHEMGASTVDKRIDGGGDNRCRPEKVQTPHLASMPVNCTDFIFL